MRLNDSVRLLRQTISECGEDNVPLLAAALAYYMLFSRAPLLIIAIAIAGLVFGEEAARGEIIGRIQGLIGKAEAEVVQTMLQNAYRPESGGKIATILGIVILLFGASSVFGQLQAALNTVWEVRSKPGRAVKGFIQARLLSFIMVLIVGFLLLAFLILSAVLTALSQHFGTVIPGFLRVIELLNFIIPLGVTTLLLAVIYKFLPDVKVSWKNLWIGSGVTALLFTLGKSLIGLYLGSVSISSAYGAAGSLVVLLIWVFYSAQILLFGAEFIQVYSRYYGSPIEPSRHAVQILKHRESSLQNTHPR
jgi:membrane protein